ncbi:MAG: hypothetical protein WKG03_00010 [Telluria sp.]
MAIQAKAAKGGVVIPKAYLIITATKMEKYLRPTEDPKTGRYNGGVMHTQHTARVALYGSKSERESNFGMSDFNQYFTFEHVPGADLITEAYAQITNIGLPGWELMDMVDV